MLYPGVLYVAYPENVYPASYAGMFKYMKISLLLVLVEGEYSRYRVRYVMICMLVAYT